MPAHPRTTAHARLRPLVFLLLGCLLPFAALCTVVHETPEEPRRTTLSVTAPTAEPHGPHQHRGPAECSHGAVVRTAAGAPEHPPTGPATVTATVAAAVAVPRGPRGRRAPGRRRKTRTGRAALVRTSRWRI
ncbi:hypothetical protein [Streptomyces sp. NPDC002845]